MRLPDPEVRRAGFVMAKAVGSSCFCQLCFEEMLPPVDKRQPCISLLFRGRPVTARRPLLARVPLCQSVGGSRAEARGMLDNFERLVQFPQCLHRQIRKTFRLTCASMREAAT